MYITTAGILASALYAAFLAVADIAVNFNAAAVAGLLVAAISAYTSARLLKANRSRILGEAASHATAALDVALRRYESDNGKLRERVEHLEAVEVELRELLVACAGERDDAVGKVEDLNRRLRAFEDHTAALVARIPKEARHGLLEAVVRGADVTPADDRLTDFGHPGPQEP